MDEWLLLVLLSVCLSASAMQRSEGEALGRPPSKLCSEYSVFFALCFVLCSVFWSEVCDLACIDAVYGQAWTGRSYSLAVVNGGLGRYFRCGWSTSGWMVDDHYCHLWQDCTPPSPLCKSTNSAQWLKRAVVSSGRHTSRLTSDDTQRNLCQPINKTLVDEEEDIDKELDNEVDKEVDTSSSTNQQNPRGQGGGHHALLVRHVLFDIQAQYRDQQTIK